MHKLLARQLRRYLGDSANALSGQWQALLQAVSESYQHSDEDRALLERSLEISSKELGDMNEHLRREIETVKNSKAHNEELERMNKFMIGRELRMAELKDRIRQLTEENNRLQAALDRTPATTA